MKNKIKRFAKGDFHIPQPEIIFPETHIIMRVGEGEKYQGSFSRRMKERGRSAAWCIHLLTESSVWSRALTEIR